MCSDVQLITPADLCPDKLCSWPQVCAVGPRGFQSDWPGASCHLVCPADVVVAFPW